MRTKKKLLIILFATVFFSFTGMMSVFVLNEFIPLSTSNSVLYFVRSDTGGIGVTRDLFMEDADRLLFMIDFSGILASVKREIAIARSKSSLELTWDAKRGVGDIKQFRQDGTVLAISFSRYTDESGTPRGLFLGGELPYGDAHRSPDLNSSGFGFFDGKDWNHIWCSSNEGFGIVGKDVAVVPSLWAYKGSRVLKNTDEEIIIESRHEVSVEGASVRMTRRLAFRSEDDYYVMSLGFTNLGTSPLSYNYAYGDEPWVGSYNSSEGDIGWYGGGIVKYEKFISPTQNSYAGFWDEGNDAAGERTGGFSGRANFIEWLSPPPSYVYFSNSFEDCCDETAPLKDEFKRVLDVVWMNQFLRPGETRDHTFAVGMAHVDSATGLPVKPEIRARF